MIEEIVVWFMLIVMILFKIATFAAIIYWIGRFVIWIGKEIRND